MIKTLFVSFILFWGLLSSVFAADIYTCPKLTLNGKKQLAVSVDLYSGHPSEMAMLKPDNADTDDKSDLYWSMGASQYDYWVVCQYGDNKTKREFKLTKNYQSCRNIGSSQHKNKLKCH